MRSRAPAHLDVQLHRNQQIRREKNTYLTYVDVHAAAHHFGLGLSAGRVAATTAAGSLAALRASHLRLEALSQVRKLDEKVREWKEVAASHVVKSLRVRSLEARVERRNVACSRNED